MITLTCPKCRQGMADAALDAGQCPACGFSLDGPVVLGPRSRSGRGWLALAAGGVLLASAAAGGYAVFSQTEAATTRPARSEVAALPSSEAPVRHVAPYPHEPKRPAAVSEVPAGSGDQGQPPVEPPKRDGPRPIGVVMKVDPKVAAVRHFDHPDDTAALPDLNSGARVTLSGKVRVLRLGSVHGTGSVDASKLVAEEVVITGDLNGEAVVTVNAPGGKVTLGGYVAGSSKLTVVAPGGEVVLANSGRFTGGATITITAKRLETVGLLTGGAKVNVTFSPARGSLKIARADEGATVTFKKAAPTDPAPGIETGDMRGGAKVLAGN